MRQLFTAHGALRFLQVNSYCIELNNIVTCWVVRVTKIMGSSLRYLDLLALRLQILLITLSYNAIAILHTFSSPLHTCWEPPSSLVVS
jgi:hypothetical protein